MARKQKLKVFRTPTGFHDAYVAAPSRKAALEAWGSDADLFARGIAELVTDEELSREPLARPGEVIRRSRGTAAEQLAALPADEPGSRWAKDDAEDDAAPVVRRKAASRSKARADPETAPKSRGRSKSAAEKTPEPAPKARPKAIPRPSRAKLDEAESALAKLVERQGREEDDLRARERALEKERRSMEAAHGRDRRTAEGAVDREREAHAERLDHWIEENG